MGNIFNSLVSVAQSMSAMQKSLAIVSNNVSNAKTPGYVRQDPNLRAKLFDVNGGLSGGVDIGGIINGRRAYLERGVQVQGQRVGRSGQFTQSLQQIEPIFDISQQSGLATGLDRLFNSFSQLSVSPNNNVARQSVISAAREVAQAFQTTTSSLGNAAIQSDVELRASVEAINRIGASLAKLNNELRQDARRLDDPGLDAQIHAALEELSEHADFTVLRGSDGSFNVYLGGQTPLALGDKVFAISADFSGATPRLLNQEGKEITSQIQQGRVRGLIDFRTTILPSLQTDLNQLAQTLADRVNETLLNGVDANGQSPAINLFQYDSVVGAAATLSVTGIRPEELAAARADAPGGNGNALDLAALGTSRQVGEFTFSQYYGQIAGGVGRSLANAREDERSQRLVLSQARSFRAEVSEVSLDEEAVKLVEFQRAYQASAELVRVLNSLTDEMLGLLR